MLLREVLLTLAQWLCRVKYRLRAYRSQLRSSTDDSNTVNFWSAELKYLFLFEKVHYTFRIFNRSSFGCYKCRPSSSTLSKSGRNRGARRTSSSAVSSQEEASESTKRELEYPVTGKSEEPGMALAMKRSSSVVRTWQVEFNFYSGYSEPS